MVGPKGEKPPRVGDFERTVKVGTSSKSAVELSDGGRVGEVEEVAEKLIELRLF